MSSFQSQYFSPLSPYTGKPELVEKNKAMHFSKTATQISELKQASSISNANLPITLQSAAFLGDY